MELIRLTQEELVDVILSFLAWTGIEHLTVGIEMVLDCYKIMLKNPDNEKFAIIYTDNLVELFGQVYSHIERLG